MRTISIALAALVLAACSKDSTPEVVPSAVETAAVREVSTGNATRYSATVEPDAQVVVAFRVGGYVEEIAVEEGDRVARGAVLARVRSSDYADRVSQASASQTEANAALFQAKSDLARAQSLYAANALTKPELDAATTNVEMSQARVNRGRAATGEASLALRDTTLAAPIDGVILRRNVERGDLGAPGAPAFILADTRTVKVTFGAPDTMIGALKIGEAIGVTTESMPDRTFNGTVARIAPAADPKTRNFDVEIHIDNASNELKPGMVASIEVSREATALLAIPLDAVIRVPRTNDGYAVYVSENGKAVARRVDLGEPMGNLVTLHGGLRKGEQVIVSGPALLVEGQPIRVVNGGTNAR